MMICTKNLSIQKKIYINNDFCQECPDCQLGCLGHPTVQHHHAVRLVGRGHLLLPHQQINGVCQTSFTLHLHTSVFCRSPCVKWLEFCSQLVSTSRHSQFFWLRLIDIYFSFTKGSIKSLSKSPRSNLLPCFRRESNRLTAF